MKSGSFFKIVASIVEFAWLVVAASQAGMAGQKNVFLVPVPEEPSWQEFAYLAAVPAGQTINDSDKAAVIALNGFGTIPEEVEDYLDRYSPNDTYLIDCGVDPGDPNEALVAWWKLDESSGTVTHDETGNYDGTLQGNATWTTGIINGALRVSGSSGNVDCGVGVTLTADLTVGAWLKANRMAYQRPITCSAGDYSTEPGWMIMMRDNGKIWFRVHGSGAWNGGDVVLDNAYVYCLRLSFPVFKQPECGSFQSEVFATAANISSAFGKNFRRLA